MPGVAASISRLLPDPPLFPGPKRSFKLFIVTGESVALGLHVTQGSPTRAPGAAAHRAGRAPGAGARRPMLPVCVAPGRGGAVRAAAGRRRGARSGGGGGMAAAAARAMTGAGGAPGAAFGGLVRRSIEHIGYKLKYVENSFVYIYTCTRYRERAGERVHTCPSRFGLLQPPSGGLCGETEEQEE